MRPLRKRLPVRPAAKEPPTPATEEKEHVPAAPVAATASGASGASMNLRDHLTELRTRLFRCLIAIFAGFVGVFYFAPIIRGQVELVLRKSLPPGGEITFIDLIEPFMVDMQLAFIVGIFAVSPYLFYQIWAFIAPGLYESERKYVVPVALCSALFFIAGGAFCYIVVIPFTYNFFIGYGSVSAKPMITLANMFHNALRLFIAFGIIFEMPLFSFFLAKLRIVTASRMRSWRKYAILAIFIIAALITPPDVYSQLLLAGPMILLYEISILIVAASQPKAKKAPADNAAA